MSFASDVKKEICQLKFSKSENIAELSGFLRTNAKYTKNNILLTSENAKVAKRIYLLIKDIYGINCIITEKRNAVFNKSLVYTIDVEEKVATVLKDLSVINEEFKHLEMPKEYIVGSTEEIKAYIRGAFLSKGSINDPKTSMYHLEFVFDNKKEAVFVQRLLNTFDLDSKILLREEKCMVYIKDSEKISDFLKLISAFNAVLYYENIRAHKEQKNVANRLNNCEQANTDKTIQSATSQIEDIELIAEAIGLNILDEKIKEAAEYRLKYPETSLTELSEIISIETHAKITKSGLNHRFRKLKEIAKSIRDNAKS